MRQVIARRAWLTAFAWLTVLAIGPWAFTASPALAQAQTGADIFGRVLDTKGGLPVPGATVELDRGDQKIATTTTDSYGAFRFHNQSPGIYTVLISASGYRATRLQELVIIAGQSQVTVQTAIERSSGTTLRTIANVSAPAHGALQSTSTITNSVSPSLLQDQNSMRAGDVLATVPFVNTSTSSAVGDAMSLSIRGFDPTETATLLDGHPVGPIGAQGSGYDYQVSPFWGLSDIDVVYGSGATGLYGANTIAGAVNFQTIDPTRDPHATIEQGVGNNGKLLTGLQATGTLGKLGYALADGVESTYGMYIPQQITQTGLLQNSASNCPPNGSADYPDITPANRATCTYEVSGNYTLRNALGKLVYTFDPKTSLALTAFAATAYGDKTGNGDTDYLPYPTVLYDAQLSLAGNNNQTSITLPNGRSITCTGTVAVNTTSGLQCFSLQRYAQTFAGPFGGGPSRWVFTRNQDYHARLTQQIGSGTLLIDGFYDNYGDDESKGIGGPYPTDIFATHGLLISDEYTSARNDVAFGFYSQHQEHIQTDLPNPPIPTGSLTTASYFIRDAFSPTLRFSVFADIWLQRSYNTRATNFDPRISFVYRPTPSDVLRVTGGRSYSEPDPNLLNAPVLYVAPSVVNPICGVGDLNVVASGSNVNLIPETADDVEFAYGHRFNQQAVLQADVYSAYERNALFPANFPLTTLPASAFPTPALLAAFLNRIDAQCGPGHTINDLGVATVFNAGGARYQGIGLSLTAGLARYLKLNADYNIQSASYVGVSDFVLQANPVILNNAQILGVPARTANLGLAYEAPSGLELAMDGHYIGVNNGLNRGAYSFVDANIAQTFGGRITLNFGINNLFNSVASQYGFVGLGPYQPENQFGTDKNAFDQASEPFSLPFRQVWMTITFRR